MLYNILVHAAQKAQRFNYNVKTGQFSSKKNCWLFWKSYYICVYTIEINENLGIFEKVVSIVTTIL